MFQYIGLCLKRDIGSTGVCAGWAKTPTSSSKSSAASLLWQAWRSYKFFMRSTDAHLATHHKWLNMWASPRVRRDILGRERRAVLSKYLQLWANRGPLRPPTQPTSSGRPASEMVPKTQTLTLRCTQVWQVHAIMSSIYSGKIGKSMWKLDQLLNHPQPNYPNWPWGWCQALETSNRCVVSQPDQICLHVCADRAQQLACFGQLSDSNELEQHGMHHVILDLDAFEYLWIPLVLWTLRRLRFVQVWATGKSACRTFTQRTCETFEGSQK